MAKRGPKPKPPSNPDHYTDRCRGMRRRFKRELILTLLTWLQMSEESYAKQSRSLTASATGCNRELLLGMAARFRSIAEACGTLAADVIEPWSEYRWQDTLAAVTSSATAAEQPPGA